ncbi:MAG: serine hydrolase [Hormoscilla sp.]
MAQFQGKGGIRKRKAYGPRTMGKVGTGTRIESARRQRRRRPMERIATKRKTRRQMQNAEKVLVLPRIIGQRRGNASNRTDPRRELGSSSARRQVKGVLRPRRLLDNARRHSNSGREGAKVLPRRKTARVKTRIKKTIALGERELTQLGKQLRDKVPVFPGKKLQVSGRKPPVSPVMYVTRMLIAGIGISAIAGTALSIWDPATRDIKEVSQGQSDRAIHAQQIGSFNGPRGSAKFVATGLKLSEEMYSLREEVQTLAAANSQLTPGVFILELDGGAYVEVNSNSTFAAASTIKLPILVAFFQDVDAGRLRLDSQLTLGREHVATGSGTMQYHPLGSQYSALEAARMMIAISDNTATNMLIERLGGIDVLNQRFKSWGLQKTVLRNHLPDIEGTNTTNPRDLAYLMARIDRGDLTSGRSRDRMLEIMEGTETTPLLKPGLGEGATIAYKTGNIGSMIADVGLISLPKGKRYIAAIMVNRPFNDDRARELITQISRAAYRKLELLEVPPSSLPDPAIPAQMDPESPENLPIQSVEATAKRG